MTKRICSIGGCGRPWYSRKWCHAHYERWRTCGDVRADRPVERRSSPKVATCSIDGCGKTVCARGWCRMHYYRWSRHGDPFVDIPPIRVKRPPDVRCSSLGCVKAGPKRGMCSTHYRHWLLVSSIRFGPPPTAEEAAARIEAERRYHREYKKAEYHRNPDHVRARSRAWRAANLDRVRLMDKLKVRRRRSAPKAPFTVDQLAAKITYWGDRCWICRADAEAIDHVKPLNAGGWHALANLRPICTSCNSAKRDRWPFPTSPLAHQDHRMALVA